MSRAVPVTPTGIGLADGESDELTAAIVAIEREAMDLGRRSMRAGHWRQLRVDAGLSLRALETRTGINRGRLSMIERGLAPSPDEALAILYALNPAIEVRS
jgi:hypothetical protein